MQVIEKGSGKYEVYYEQGNTIHRTRYTTLSAASKEARKLSFELGMYITVNKHGVELKEWRCETCNMDCAGECDAPIYSHFDY